MKVGVISDIHADVTSLKTVMRRFDQAGIRTIVCCGDLVERGSDGNAVVGMLRESSIPCVKGNHDENALRHAILSRNLDESGRLSAESLEFLQGLPPSLGLTIDEIDVLLTHAIPSDNGGAAFQDESLVKFSKQFKKDLAKVDAEIVIVGHTHFPFNVSYRDKWILNPGCVCRLQSRDSHTYGILDLAQLSFAVFDVSSGEPYEPFTATLD